MSDLHSNITHAVFFLVKGLTMSRRVICLAGFASLFVPGTLHADDTEGWTRRVIVGANLGLDFSTVGGSERNDTNIDFSYRTGPTGGGLAAVQLTRIFAAQFEINFAAKGDRADTGSPGTSSTLHLDYLEVPILAHARLPISEGIVPHAYLGPAFSVLLDADIRYDDGRFYETIGSIKPFDIGVVFGLGTAVAIGNAGAITFDIRYNLGLRDRAQGAVDDSESFNRAIYLTVGYRADLATLGRLFGGDAR